MITLGDEMPAYRVPPFSPAEIGRYVDASGDSNRLHRDDAYARSFGLGGVVVPGMQLVGQCEAALASWCDAGIVSLTGRFVKPVVAGEALAVGAKVVARSGHPGAEFIVRFTFRSEAGVVCVADAHVKGRGSEPGR